MSQSRTKRVLRHMELLHIDMHLPVDSVLVHYVLLEPELLPQVFQELEESLLNHPVQLDSKEVSRR